jgi:hypothetical protein
MEPKPTFGLLLVKVVLSELDLSANKAIVCVHRPRRRGRCLENIVRRRGEAEERRNNGGKREDQQFRVGVASGDRVRQGRSFYALVCSLSLSSFW